METGEQTTIQREAPLIEAYKTGLLESAKSQVDATNRNALEGKYLSPDYQIAGMSQNQMNALNAGAAGIGYGMYNLSRKCGARSSDLFGVLSQILPPSATSPHPVVCTAN